MKKGFIRGLKAYFADNEIEMPDISLDSLARQGTRDGFLSLEEVLFTRVAELPEESHEPLDRLFADIGWKIIMAEQEYSRSLKNKPADHVHEYNLLLKYFTR